MLRQLRSRKVTKRIMFWTLVLVIPSFVFFYGWQSSSRRRGASRASGEREGLVLFKHGLFGLRDQYSSPMAEEMARRALEQEYLYVFQNQGLRVAPEEIRGLVGPREIARRVMEDYYLDRLVRQEGLEVTEGELLADIEDSLRGRPLDELKKQIQRQGMSEQEFLDDLRYRKELHKARSVVFSLAKVSVFDLWQEYLIGQEKIQIRYVRIPTQDFDKQVQSTSDSLKAFYEAHSNDYGVGDRADFRYVAVFRSDCEQAAQPTTDSVRAFYEKNKEKLFSRKRSVNVRHILIKVPSDAPTSDVIRADRKIRDIAAKIKTGASFADVANTNNEDSDNVDPKDPTKKLGGVIPTPIREESRSVFGDEFKKAALALAVDEVSSPVRATQGFHLIKCDKVTTAGIMTFDEVKDQARQTLHDEMTDAEFRKRGEHLKTLFNEKAYSTLDSFAEGTSLPIGQTGLVDLDSGFLPRIGPISDSIDLAKSMGVGEFSEAVLKSPEAYFVLELKRKEPAHVPPFEQVVKEVTEDYITSAAATLARRTAVEIARQAKTLDDLQRLAEKRGYPVKQSEMFTREQAGSVLPNLDPQFRYMTLRDKVGSIHATAQGDPKRPVAFVVWYFEKLERPTLEQFRKDLPTIRAEYLAQLQEALLQEWLHDEEKRIPARINPVYESKAQEESGKTQKKK